MSSDPQRLQTRRGWRDQEWPQASQRSAMSVPLALPSRATSSLAQIGQVKWHGWTVCLGFDGLLHLVGRPCDSHQEGEAPMETFFGLLAWILIIALILGFRGERKRVRSTTP